MLGHKYTVKYYGVWFFIPWRTFFTNNNHQRLIIYNVMMHTLIFIKKKIIHVWFSYQINFLLQFIQAEIT